MAKAARYSRILEAAKLYSAVDNYIKYITDSTKKGLGVGQGKARVKSKLLYIKPFGIELALTQYAPVSAAEPTWSARKSVFNDFTKDTIPTTNTAIKLANFSAARVVIVTGRSTQSTVKRSKVTGLPYNDYGGTSTSVPFGSSGAETGDAELEAFETIRTAIIQASAGVLVSRIPEKI